MKSKAKIYNFTALATIVLFAVISCMNIFHEPRKMSEKENRELLSSVEFSMEKVMDGSFMKEFEKYAAEQFVWRDGAVSIKADAEKVLGKKGNNGVHFGKDGYLIARPGSFNAENVDKNLAALRQLDELGTYNMTLAVIPTAFEVLKDKLPGYAYDDRIAKITTHIADNTQDTNMRVCDTTGILKKHSDEYIFYRGDHHQTALGSYYVYTALGEYLDYEPYELKDFKRERLSRTFQGTSWSKASTSFMRPDTVEKFTLKNSVEQTMEFPLEDKSFDSLYSMDKLKTKDKYSVYLDGNHALTVVKSELDSGRKLAVLKDSYAHSIAPFLANHYDEVHLVDMRYYNDDIIRYLGENGVTDLLVLYNAEGFETDTNLEKAGECALTTDYFDPPPFGFLPETDRVSDDYFADAVFFGDSLIVGYSYGSGLPARFVCKSAVNTRTVRTAKMTGSGKPVFQELLEEEDVGKYYLMLGINEVSYQPVDKYISDYRGLIDELRAKSPNAIIYIQSVMPIARKAENSITNKKIAAYNDALVKLAEEAGCYYLNVNGWIAEKNGYLRDDAAVDGIHFGVSDHKKWDEYLRKHAVQDKRKNKNLKKFELYTGGGSINMDAVAREMIDCVPFVDKLNPVKDNMVARMFNLSEGEAVAGVVYTGSGSTAEEFAVFEASSNEAAHKLAEKLKARVEARKQDYETYRPAEMPKLKNPVIVVDGNMAAMCVSDDNGAAETVFGHY